MTYEQLTDKAIEYTRKETSTMPAMVNKGKVIIQVSEEDIVAMLTGFVIHTIADLIPKH